MIGVLHVFYNQSPVTQIVALTGRLMDAHTWINAAPDDRIIARLVKRGALVDLGPVPDPEQPPEE